MCSIKINSGNVCGYFESQGEFSSIDRWSIAQSRDMETGKRSTTLEKFALICEHYQVSADYLLGFQDEER